MTSSIRQKGTHLRRKKGDTSDWHTRRCGGREKGEAESVLGCSFPSFLKGGGERKTRRGIPSGRKKAWRLEYLIASLAREKRPWRFPLPLPLGRQGVLGERGHVSLFVYSGRKGEKKMVHREDRNKPIRAQPVLCSVRWAKKRRSSCPSLTAPTTPCIHVWGGGRELGSRVYFFISLCLRGIKGKKAHRRRRFSL